jgi:hypothetical protein
MQHRGRGIDLDQGDLHAQGRLPMLSGIVDDLEAVIKAHNLIDIKTKPRHPESNCIAECFNGTVRADSNDDYDATYLQAEAIIGKLMHHYNEDRLHAPLGYMTPATWHRGQPDQVRDERARRLAAAHAHRKTMNQQRFTQAA